ncbi:uncharacterized protein V6R79_001633 [Siganus canaliculatus]
MVLNNRSEDLNIRFRVRVADFDYVLFATSANMRCFGCGEEGHLIKACPNRTPPVPAPETAPLPLAGASGATGVSGGGAAAEEGAIAGVAGGGAAAAGDAGDASAVGSESQAGKESQVGEDSQQGEDSLLGEESLLGEDSQVGEDSLAGKMSQAGEEMQEGEAPVPLPGVSGGVMAVDGEQTSWIQIGLKRRSVRVSEAAKAKGEVKAGEVKAGEQAADTQLHSDSSDAEASDTDRSDASLWSEAQVAQAERLYPASMFRSFLVKTKCVKGVNLKKYFPNKQAFYFSAKRHIQNRAESGFTDQEVFRLKKLMGRVRKDLK